MIDYDEIEAVYLFRNKGVIAETLFEIKIFKLKRAEPVLWLYPIFY
jgi:hypothetical protein